MSKGTPSPRLSVLFAPSAPIALIFRRGPSKWTLLTKWRTDRDTFTDGDWFYGSLYPRRSDLSPDGRFLVYFAAFSKQPRFRSPQQSWTGISEIPSLQPLASWPKEDCWFGGGLFDGPRRLLINDRDGETIKLPNGISASFNPDAYGEDEPVYSKRLARDGWTLEQERVTELRNSGYKTFVPELRRKTDGRAALVMSRSLDRYAWRDTYTVEAGSTVARLEDVEWADFDKRGRLVAGRDGQILEIKLAGTKFESRIIRDFAGTAPPDDEVAAVSTWRSAAD